MKKIILTLALAILSVSCASVPKCPSVLDQPVSSCRAEVDCGSGSFSTGLGMMISGMGAGMNGQRNLAVDNYNSCVERNLSAQKANSGAPDTTGHCVSRKISNDEIQTECH